MKIVYVYPIFAHLAGTERVFTDKMNYLSEQMGYEVVLLTYEQGQHELPFPLSPKVKHVDLNVRFFPLYKVNRIIRWYKIIQLRLLLTHRFNSFLSKFSPDIVIASTYYADVVSMIAKCPGDFVRILESHIDKRYILCNDPRNRKSIFQIIRASYDTYIENKYSRQFDMLVALSQNDANDWSGYLKTIVIPNIVHLNEKGVYTNWVNKKVIFAGRFLEQKGIFDLLKIWKLIHMQHPEWQLDIYGEGELRNQLIDEVEKLNINITIHPPVYDILREFCNSSIFVMSSLYEPFGLVLVEAMSCGLPVVCFDCPHGPSQIVNDGVDGFLIPGRDISLFAKHVCDLMESFELRRKMGLNGIESSKRYSAERIMPQWIGLFNNLVQNKHHK